MPSLSFARPRAAKPGARQLLLESLKGPAVAYSGRLKIEIFAKGEKTSRRAGVSFSPPAKYRREIIGSRRHSLQTFVSDGTTAWIYDPAASKAWTGPASQRPGAVSGLEDGYDLIAGNYDVSISTSKPVAGRPVWELDLASRFDGKIRRRLWIDKKNSLVLKSEILSPDGTVSSEVHFTHIAFGPQDAAQFSFTPPAGASVSPLILPDPLTLKQAEAASGLKASMPGWLPAGFVFEGLAILPRAGQKVIHYRFSDGIDALSLFQCPAGVSLDFGEKSLEKVSLGGLSGTLAWSSEGPVFAWTPRGSASRGSQFILVGPVSPEILEKMAESLP